MSESKSKTAKTKSNHFEKSASYKVGNTTFIVQRVFREEGGENINAILVKLMRHDTDRA